jgi:pyruvate/2-oxoglutarate dehydrogenase complex dihydrolipoamide acyltransferase (E2) component
MNDPRAVTVPRENVNDQTVMLVAWLVADGAHVDPGQPVVEVEGSKTTFQITALSHGVLRHTRPVGAEIEIGGELGRIEGVGEESRAVAVNGKGTPAPLRGRLEQPSAPIAETVAPSQESAMGLRLSEVAMNLARAHGLEPEAFAGRGLVRSRDVLNYLGESTPEKKERELSRQSDQAPQVEGVPYRVEKLSRAKRTEATYLRSGARHALPSAVSVAVTTRGLRSVSIGNPQLQGNVTALIVFEVARLLKQYPRLNACHHEGNAHLYDEANIGVAMDSGHGLKVPVLRNADRKGIPELVSEMRELVVHYLNDTLPVESLSGGTFTVTDLSGEEVVNFLPLLNQGQSAILGIGAELFLPGSQVGFFNLTLAFDHQLSEGRRAARFLRELRDRLQHYEAALQPRRGVEQREPFCTECLRPASELRALRAHLVQTVGTDHSSALVCSVCLAGF